jgi:hypothetical protein
MPYPVSAINPPSPAPNPIQVENALAGDSTWNNITGANQAHLAAFADAMSVALGGTINFYVASDSAACTADIYRLGWYNGAGGRKIQTISFNATNKLSSTTVNTTYSLGGSVGVLYNYYTAQYQHGFSLAIPNSWVSGLYLARIYQGSGSFPTWVPFIVTNPFSQSTFVNMFNDTTWQAYSAVGGYSIYAATAGNFGARVSYDRPWTVNTTALNQAFTNWELQWVRWLEKNGYDVTYVGCADVEYDPSVLRRHAVVLTAGHAEYWSKTMWNAFRKARDNGTSLGAFCANTAYKRIRWLDSDQYTGPRRMFECYEHFPYADPLADTSERAGRAQWNGDWPNALFGVGFGGVVTANGTVAFTCADAANWAFAGTGMATNDTIAGIVGYEFDTLQPGGTPVCAPSPAGIQTIASTTGISVSGGDTSHYSTYYQHKSGAGVFGAGTVSWTWGLDNYLPAGNQATADSRLQQITANVLARLAATGKASS